VDPADPESVRRWTMPLNELVVRTWDRHGGTNLGSSRTNPFKAGQDRGDLVLGNIAALGNGRPGDHSAAKTPLGCP
jgi:6-phosphofructokinase 1